MRYLVTGSSGTVGSSLIQYLLRENSENQIVGIDNNESKLFFQQEYYIDSQRISFHLADIRDFSRIEELMRGVDVVFHAAALKHVVICERSPMDAVQTNIMGLKNIIAAARKAGVKKVVFTSSDKAVNPTNVMGTSKLMGERIVTAANSGRGRSDTIFTSTRFGNILGSNGSVISIFRKQILLGQPVTLTDSGMTRFVMTVEEAVRLVVDSANLAKGGEVFVTKMPAIRIQDLAHVMIETLAPAYGRDPASIPVKVIGAKPGEKMYEELLSDEETRRAVELKKYFVVMPAFRGIYDQIEYEYLDQLTDKVSLPYNSANQRSMNRDELRAFLQENQLLAPDNV